MAGHSKFKNIQHRKGAQDKKRAKIFTRLVKEIITAVKVGGADVDANPRLRTALVGARSQNLPKDKIEKAMNKGSDSNSEAYIEIRYEGFLNGGIAIIIEALTDNKNRTVAAVRSTLTKYAGSLSESGSVSFLFDKIGKIIYPKSIDDIDNLIEATIDAGGDDVIEEDDMYIIHTSPENYNQCLESLTEKYQEPLESEIIWMPKDQIKITDNDKLEKIQKVIDILEDNEDIQNIFTNHTS